MKFNFISATNIQIYIINKCFKVKDIYNKDEMLSYIKRLLYMVKEKYELDINGLYDINLYENKTYGVILDIQKEDIDYYDLFTNAIDISLVIHEDTPMYICINDPIEDNIYIKYNLIKKDSKYLINITDIKDISIYEKGYIVYT